VKREWKVAAALGIAVVLCVALAHRFWARFPQDKIRASIVWVTGSPPRYEEHLPIDWKFGPPDFMFDYYRSNGKTWITGFEIHAKNRTGEVLVNPHASMRSDRDGQNFELNLALGNGVVNLGKDFHMWPPGGDMVLVAPLPSANATGPEGIPADDLVGKLGGLTFTFDSDGAATFTRHFSADDLEEQVAGIKRQSWKPR
jgi:hypothetical protein